MSTPEVQGFKAPLGRTLSRNSAARTAAMLEPQCLEFRERNETRKAALFPFPNPVTPEQHQLNRIAGIITSMEMVPHVHNLEIQGPNGPIRLRMYSPHPKATNRLPVLLFFHGGAFFLNNLDTHDGLARRLANAGSSVVISVDYRLAPQHKFPAGLEDCYAATQWASEHAEEYLGDPGRLCVAGDSAGGNIAAAVSMLAKERGGPKIHVMLLFYPMTDAPNNPGRVQGSLELYSSGYGYTAELNQMAWDICGACEPPHGTPDQPNPLAAILRYPDLSGLPPAHIALAECDIVRDEGLAFARALQRAGNECVVREYQGAHHGFIGDSVLACQLQCSISLGTHAITEALQTLKRVLGLPVPRTSMSIDTRPTDDWEL